MIGIIDYGMGNLRSVEKAFQSLGFQAFTSGDPEALRGADRVVLPGVGAFGPAMQNLRDRGLDQVAIETAASGKPFLGICLGLQLLFDTSEEMGDWTGLGLVKGSVLGFTQTPGFELKAPQIGWNSLQVKGGRMLAGLPTEPYVYFVHSYYVRPDDPSVTAAETDYGLPFCSAVESGNVWGVQFHPEKSSSVGLKILENFARS